ncbi:MAG: AAA family ATPase [Chitinophagales bacterium]
MKIEINNFGPIHHFEFDLEKDLHLIYGENNVGKSYAVNSLYLLMKNLVYHYEIAKKNSDHIRLYYLSTLKKLEKNKKSFFENLIENEWVDITKELEEGVKVLLKEELLPKIEASFQNTYSNLEKVTNRYQKNKPFFCIIRTYIGSLDIQFANSTYIDNHTFEKVYLSYQNPFDNMVGTIEVKGAISDTSVFDGKIRDILIWENIINKLLLKSYLFDYELYILPSSRSGLYQSINNFGQIFAELSQYRHQIKADFKIPSFSEPVSDYYLTLSQMNTTHFNEKLRKIGEKIEEEIFEGKISFDNTTKKIFFSPNNTDLTIEITQAASMISELAPLVLFLKHIIKEETDKKNILIIEEPEAHLHPKTQVKLMKIFAELTKHNVKIIMTSHSDYMLDKVSNMLLAKELDADKVAVYHIEMTDKGSVVKKDMEANEMGVEDTNFLPVSEELYEERMNTIDRLNQQQDAN